MMQSRSFLFFSYRFLRVSNRDRTKKKTRRTSFLTRHTPRSNKVVAYSFSSDQRRLKLTRKPALLLVLNQKDRSIVLQSYFKFVASQSITTGEANKCDERITDENWTFAKLTARLVLARMCRSCTIGRGGEGRVTHTYSKRERERAEGDDPRTILTK